jgi:hypothetical protein
MQDDLFDMKHANCHVEKEHGRIVVVTKSSKVRLHGRCMVVYVCRVHCGITLSTQSSAYNIFIIVIQHFLHVELLQQIIVLGSAIWSVAVRVLLRLALCCCRCRRRFVIRFISIRFEQHFLVAAIVGDALQDDRHRSSHDGGRVGGRSNWPYCTFATLGSWRQISHSRRPTILSTQTWSGTSKCNAMEMCRAAGQSASIRATWRGVRGKPSMRNRFRVVVVVETQ